MSVLVVSDIHIGNYRSQHRRLYRFLESHKDTEFVIIAGDLFDLWAMNAAQAFKQGKYLLDYLYTRFRDKIIYLTGNHDEDLQHAASLNGIPIGQFYHMNRADKNLVVCHGHQYDNSFYLNQAGGLARINAWATNRVSRWLKMDFRKKLIGLSDQIKTSILDKIVLNYESNLKREFTGACDLVVTGHMHDPCIKRFDKLTYVNVGDWMAHSTAALISDEQVELIAIDDSVTRVINSHRFKPT